MNTTDTTAATNPQRRLFTRELRVRLTETEVTERGRKLAARRADRAQLDEKRKAVAKDYGGQLAQIDAELDGLQGAIQTGSELRPVQCYEDFRAGVIEIRRADNDEVIDTRIPTLSEQQVPLPGVDDDDGAGLGDPWDAGDGEGDDDFGGAVARAGVELVESATGGVVAHMPDDEGEAPDPGALGELAKPAKAAKKGRAPRKAK